jgi:hypothetical protein
MNEKLILHNNIHNCTNKDNINVTLLVVLFCKLSYCIGLLVGIVQRNQFFSPESCYIIICNQQTYMYRHTGNIIFKLLCCLLVDFSSFTLTG